MPWDLVHVLHSSYVAFYLFLSYTSNTYGEGNGTPLQYSCLENPMDGGAWRAAVHGVAKSRTRLSDFTFTSHFPALEKVATHSSVLAWRVPGTGEPGGLPSMGSHRVGHDWSNLAAVVVIHKYQIIEKIETNRTLHSEMWQFPYSTSPVLVPTHLLIASSQKKQPLMAWYTLISPFSVYLHIQNM